MNERRSRANFSLILHPTVNGALGLSRFFQRLSSGLEFSLLTLWVGKIDVLWAVVPVADRGNVGPGLTAVARMCGHERGIAPTLGCNAPNLNFFDDPGADLSQFWPGRFGDCRRVGPGPNI